MKRHASLNRIYRLVWNQALSAWVAVAECARGRGKSSARRKLIVNVAAAAAALALAMSPYAQAGPTDGQVVAGSGSISQAGHTTTINQSSQNLAINWSDFSVAAHEAVRFNQPNASSIVLNRVLGQSISQIRGAISANGQVFILNPNGVIFGAGAQVDVGGLVASTLSLSNDDFMANRFSFSNNGESGSIINQGTLTAAQQGYIAMLAPQVINEGVISATLGSAVLAAGNQVTLNLSQGSLVGFSIDRGAFQALVDNKQLIEADGGQVFMSAKAAAAITTAMVNNSGIVEARTLGMVNGRIEMISDMAVGSTHVAGKLDASAPNGGDGGFIETSGAHVKIADDARITTAAPSGNTGSWLIDPFNFTVAASGGDTSGLLLSTSLASSHVTIQTNNTSGGDAGDAGDIFINDAISWSAPKTLTLDAYRNIEINQAITASNASGKLALKYGQGDDYGVIDSTTATYRINAPVNLQAGENFSTKLGSAGTVKNYFVITQLGDVGSGTAEDLQGINDNLLRHYALGANIDASATATWNGGAGFVPLGNSSERFAGDFEGLGHTITGLTINRPTTDYVGLFGAVQNSAISNVGLVDAVITGQNNVGGLVGFNYFGRLTNSYAMATVRGNNYVGGLVGFNYNGSISSSRAAGDVQGNSFVGGLVGYNYDSYISNSYATGMVDGGASVGGLVGYNHNSFIINSYATGLVDGVERLGGLVGTNTNFAIIDNSYAKGNVTGTGEYIGGLVGLNANDGNIANSYASGVVLGDDGVGGLVGVNEAEISNSYATGAVTGGGQVGGLVGKNNSGTIRQTFATGQVSGVAFEGGLIGQNDGPVTDSFWDTSTTGMPAGYGIGLNNSVLADGTSQTGVIGLNTADFLNKANFNSPTDANGQSNVSWNFNAGSGTWFMIDGETRPFLQSEYSTTITNSHQLQLMAMNLNAHYTLANNINMTTEFNNVSGMWATNSGASIGKGFMPVGTSGQNNLFSGSFNGQNFTITGLTISRSNLDNVGLFGVTESDASINNVGLINVSINNTNTEVDATTGGLVGLNYGSISNSHVTGSVSGDSDVGGLVGFNQNSGTISNSYANVTVTGVDDVGGLVGYNDGAISGSRAEGAVSGDDNVGGLVGNNDATINSSYATGAVSGDDDIGGLVGENNGTINSNSYATGTVSGDDDVGGLVGFNYGTISNSRATGAVSGDDNVGGLVGNNDATINSSYATGAVSGDDDIGGLVGDNNGTVNGTVNSNSYATGEVFGVSDVGGLVGYNDGTISNSHSTGYVQGDRNLGGLVGYNEGTLINSFYNAETVQINGAVLGDYNGMLTVGGLYSSQYADWIADKTLDRTEYFTTNSNGALEVGSVQNFKDMLGFSQNAGLSFIQTANIYLYTSGLFMPYFAGQFNGDGYSISNATINVAYNSNIGLFGQLRGNLQGVRALNVEVSGNRNVGGLVGYNDGTISNSRATGAVSGDDGVGGLVGYNVGSISGSYADAAVSGDIDVGGLVGYNYSNISDSYSMGTVQGTTNVGGLVGYNYSNISDSYSMGTVQGDSIVGGLVGFNEGTLINSFYNAETVQINGATLIDEGGILTVAGLYGGQYADWFNNDKALEPTEYFSADSSGVYLISSVQNFKDLLGFAQDESLSFIQTASIDLKADAGLFIPYFAGQFNGNGYSISNATINVAVNNNIGLFGHLRGSLEKVHARNVEISGNDNVGGLVGFMDENSSISNSYATGAVIGNNNVGGLVGFNYNGSISYSYATASVDGEVNVGGLVGRNNDNISNSYATGSVDGADAVGGLIGINTGENVTASFWDMNTTGQLSSDGGIGKTTRQLLTQSTYTSEDWSFSSGSDSWFMIDGETRPFLQSEYSTTITNSHQLQLMAMDLDANYTLANNINMSAEFNNVSGMWATDRSEYVGKGFVPVGIENNQFTGSFNGQNFTITGLTIHRPTLNGVGLFGYGSGISNLGLIDVDITGNDYVGGLAGNNYGSISHAYVTGLVKGTDSVGGLVGYTSNDSNIAQSYSAANVDGDDEIGGLVGSNNGSISNSYATGAVYGDDNIGGLVGHNEGTISNSYATGSVAGYDNIGGLVGDNEGTISNSYATGAVSGDDDIGGLVGDNGGDVSSSYASGAVSGDDDIGGLVGYNNENITFSYAIGSVVGDDNVGGLVGSNDAAGLISNSYATGSVAGYGGVGGLVGQNTGENVTASFWDINTTGQSSSDGGVGKTTRQLLTQSTYTSEGWSFSSDSGTWFMIDGETRPFLQSEWNRTITNSHQLQLMAMDLTVRYTLANNINMTTEFNNVSGMWATNMDTSTGRGFVPVGTSPDADGIEFAGSFDGQNHTITGLTISRPNTIDIGLFGASSGNISNLGLIDVDITGNKYVGGLAGNNYGNISHAYVTGSVTGTDSVGGLVGWTSNNSNITQSYSVAGVNGTDYIGGLVGSNNGSISFSYATGSVAGADDKIGGLVGDNGGIINNSYAAGAVNGDDNVGGLVGVNNGSISNSFAIGAVNGDDGVGGLVGVNDGVISNAYVTGSVTGADYVGGLVGNNSNSISNSYAISSVSGANGVGGLVGSNTGNINQTFASGAVDGATNAGGLVGINTGGTVTASFWDTDTTGRQNSDGGFGYTTAQLLMQSTYISENWSFSSGSDSWFMIDGETRPFLQSEYSTSITNSHQLQLMAMDLSANYTLANNINMTTEFNNLSGMWATDRFQYGGKGFVPVGGENNEFTGSFDGQNHTISGLTINRADSYGVGLFGYADANISNIGLIGVSVSAGGSNSYGVGGLVGVSYGRISNSHVTGSVRGDSDVGGLVGINYGSISLSYAAANVSGSDNVGGLVGSNQEYLAQINFSHASGNVMSSNGEGYATTGGLVGENDGGGIRNSFASGNVRSETNLYGTTFSPSAATGGLVGSNYGGTIKDSYATGHVASHFTGNLTSSGDYKVGGLQTVGGLVGVNFNGHIANAYATGDVSGHFDSLIDGGVDNSASGVSKVGGLVGTAISGKIKDSYATGKVSSNFDLNINNVSATGVSKVGGLVGFNYGLLANNHASGSVTSYFSFNASGDFNNSYAIAMVGGLAGFHTQGINKIGSLITDNYATGQVFGNDSSVVGGLVGVSSGEIENSHATGNVIVSGNGYAGGLVGGNGFGLFGFGFNYGFNYDFDYGSASISNSHATGNVNVAGYGAAGGLVGINGVNKLGNIAYVDTSYATGSVSGSHKVGGLVGANDGSINNSYATGNVRAIKSTIVASPTSYVDESVYVGGLVGLNESDGSISNSYATGNVSGSLSITLNADVLADLNDDGDVFGSNFVGGLVGFNDGGSINQSYATGTTVNTTGFDSNGNDVDNQLSITLATGGLVGLNANGASVVQSYATGQVANNTSFDIDPTSGGSFVGGLIGQNNGGTVTASFWDAYTTGQITSAGSANTHGKTTAQLLMQSTYTTAGWDFGASPNSGTWFMLDGDTRPFLQSEYSTTITNSHQLQLMAMDLSANYTLANNINMTTEFNNLSGMWATDRFQYGGKGFVPVGGENNEFTGSFDGQNHTISGLTINRADSYGVGLFGYADANISNIGLIGVSVSAGGSNSYGVGGLVGYNYGQISNSFVSGVVNGENNVGGLVGFNDYGSIRNSYASATVTGSGDDVGGLVGDSEGGWFTNTYATGNVTGIDSVGGLIGENENGMVLNSYATGSVIGEEDVGGLVGYNYDGSSISNSYATGSITGTDATGGLVGKNQFASIAESYASGLVSGHYRAGGLVGQNRDGGTINNSQALGNVNGYYGVGGLVGANQEVLFGYGGVIDNDNGTSRISNSYATGNVVGTNSVGGLVGLNDSEISINFIDNVTISNSTRTVDIRNSYATGTVHGDENVGGLVGLNRSTLAVTGSSGSSITSSQSVASINKSYATGAVTINSSGSVGGLLGVNQNSNNTNGNASSASVDQSYATGSVSGDTFFAGGLIGQNDGGTVTSSFWDIDTTGQLISAGSDASYGKTTAELLMKSTYTDTGWDFTVDVNTPNDTGTWFMLNGETRPFLQSEYSTSITNSHQLQLMAMDLSANYTLANNINMSAEFNNVSGMWATNRGAQSPVGKGYVPVGGENNEFTGSFDGQNFTITGLTISRSNIDNVGLFGVTGADASISNVGLINVDISNANYNRSTGGLVGLNYGIISNSHVTGSVSGDSDVGGLVGVNVGLISNSHATASVLGFDDVGGLVGENAGNIINSYASGIVSGEYDIGGLVGASYGGSISKSYATGAVIGDGNIGGLVGSIDDRASISNSYATGNVTGTGDDIGGLVGRNYGRNSISNSYATGDVSGDDDVGGLVGDSNGGLFVNTYATGNVFGQASVGGLIGENENGIIRNSYATGNVTGTDYGTGGLVGYNYDGSSIVNSYATGNVRAIKSTIVAGLTNSVDESLYVGGLVGLNEDNSSISNSYATGSVSGSLSITLNSNVLAGDYGAGNVIGSNFVGGLVGFNDGGSISQSYATGTTVNTTRFDSNEYDVDNQLSITVATGGLVGSNANGASVVQSYATGQVAKNIASFDIQGINSPIDNQSLVGGLIGQNNGGTVTASFWDADTTGQLTSAGSDDSHGKTTTELLTQSTYTAAGWDFGASPNSGTWFMIDGETRPFLQSEYSTSITNSHQLQLMAMDLSANYSLANNINMSAEFNNVSGMWATNRVAQSPVGKGFVPVGGENNEFTGSFDGQNHTIGGLTINRIDNDDYDAGLFGRANASISNIGLINVAITNSGGYGSTGALVGYNYGQISNSYVSGSVSGDANVGGLVGFNNYGSISNSYATASVTGTGDDIGGLVGDSYGGYL